MQLLLPLLIGVLISAGVYLMLRRSLIRFVFGLVLLSNAVNLLVFTAGRVARVTPPIVPEGAEAPLEAVANPLPQALVLTAIVIGFGLIAFTLVLLYRAVATLGTADADALADEALDEEPPPAEAPPGPPDHVAMTNGRRAADAAPGPAVNAITTAGTGGHPPMHRPAPYVRP